MNQTVKQLCNDYALLLVQKPDYILKGIKHIKQHKHSIASKQQMANCLRVNNYMFATTVDAQLYKYNRQKIFFFFCYHILPFVVAKYVDVTICFFFFFSSVTLVLSCLKKGTENMTMRMITPGPHIANSQYFYTHALAFTAIGLAGIEDYPFSEYAVWGVSTERYKIQDSARAP